MYPIYILAYVHKRRFSSNDGFSLCFPSGVVWVREQRLYIEVNIDSNISVPNIDEECDKIIILLQVFSLQSNPHNSW